MRKVILVTVTVLLVFGLITIRPVSAGNPWVATFDEKGGPCDVFDIGDSVNITSYSTYEYDVVVIDPEGTECYRHTVSGGGRYTVVLEGMTDMLGWWEVKAGAVEHHYASAWYQVIPEVPLGGVAALIACFAGLGLARGKLRRAAHI